VLADHGRYFRGPDELAALYEEAEAQPAAARARGRAQIASLDRYEWDGVTDSYEALAFRLAGTRRPHHEPGRRLPG